MLPLLDCFLALASKVLDFSQQNPGNVENDENYDSQQLDLMRTGFKNLVATMSSVREQKKLSEHH